MEKKTRTALVLVLLLVVGAGIGYAVIDSYDVSQGATWDASDDGPEVTLLEDTDQVAERPLPDRHTVDLAPHGQLHSDGATSMEISGHVNSDFVTLTNIQSNGNEISATMTDQSDVTFTGDVDHLEWRQANPATENLDFAHNGDITINVEFDEAATGYIAKDVETGETLDTDTSGGTTATFSLTGQNDVTIVEQTGEPTIDRDSVEPDDETISEIPFTLAADVSHEEDVQLDAEFFVEGESVGTDTVQQDGRVETTHDENQPGEYTWTLEVTDEFGQTTSESFTFNIPDEMTIRDEIEGDIIDDQEVSVRFFAGSDRVETRSTTDGTIELDGLPADEQIIISTEAEGFEDRRVMLDSLVTQQDVFLLDETADSVFNEFSIEDRTDQFKDSSTLIRIEKPVTIDGETEYRTVTGDEIGSSGTFTTVLEQDQRYRLSVENEDGVVRSLGSYTADADGAIPLSIGTVELRPDEDTGYRFSAESTGDEDQPEITIQFVDEQALTTSLTYEIYRQGDSSEPVYGPVTVNDPTDYRDVIEPDEDATYVVEWELDRGGETSDGKTTIGGLTSLDWPVPSDVLQSMGLFALIGIAVLFGGSMSTTGSVVVAIMAFALTMVGVLAIPYPFLAMAGIISVLFKVGEVGGVRT